MLDSEAIQAILPHRYPFLLVDRIEELDPGKQAVGIKNVTANEPFFSGHFPGRPTLPGVLMCESVAQLGAYALLSVPEFAGRLPLFGGIDRARFRRQVLPGERLDLEVELVRLSQRGGRRTGQALVGGRTACSCELLFVFADEVS